METDSPIPAPEAEAPKLSRPRRRRWVSILLGVALLLSGVVIGASLATFIMFDRLSMVIHEPERIPPRIVNRMQRQLDLTDDQATKIEAIYMDLQRNLVAIRDRAMPDIEREIETARGQVMEILTPEQQENYNTRFRTLLKALLPGHKPTE